MRITIVQQYYLPDISAVAHLVASLAEDRAQRGDEVTVLCSRGRYLSDSGAAGVQEPAGVHAERIWTPGFGKRYLLGRLVDYAVFYLLAAWKSLTLPRQDVMVLLTTPPFIGWVGVLHRLLHRKTKLILWNMDCYPEAAEQAGLLRRGSIKSRLLRALNRIFFRKLDSIVCLDQAMVDLLQTNYDLPVDNPVLTTIPNWEAAKMFARRSAADAWADAKTLPLADRFVVLYLGNAGFGHRLDGVIEVAQRVKHLPITFLFVGGGKLWPQLEAEVAERSLDNVVVHGYVPKEETLAVMANADCALITLRDEALGVMSPSKLHSQLACGIPVLYLGPQSSNVDECIQRFDCGASLRHGDVDAAVRFLEQALEALEAPDRFVRMKRQARRAFDEAYCDTQTLKQFDRLLESIVSPASLPLPSGDADEATPLQRAA